MKYFRLITGLTTGFIYFLLIASPDCTINLKPKWQNLEHNEQRAKEFGGKWILAGSITFCKKGKEKIHLSKLYLRWQGKPIEKLLGSLYKKTDEFEFLPIQENLVCDGTWNKKHQTLILNFDQKQILGLANTFYLVLTVPDSLEKILQRGSFTLVRTCLPEPFQGSDPYTTLSLTFNKTVAPPCIPTKLRLASNNNSRSH